MSVYPREYAPINRGTIQAVQIDNNNVAELNTFYQTEFKIGEYLILPDSREDTEKVAFRRACIWDKERFEDSFEEKI